MNSTASDLPRLKSKTLGAGSVVPGGRGHFFVPFEALTGFLTAGAKSEQWALQAWNPEGRLVWVRLDATGGTVMDPTLYQHLTAHHLDMEVLPRELLATMDELEELRELPPGWNGYDVSAPSPTAINTARIWVQTFYWEALEAAGSWIMPHVTADETGEVMFEWSKGNKALTAYVAENEVTLARDWGPNVETQMETELDPTAEIDRQWWAWLVG